MSLWAVNKLRIRGSVGSRVRRRRRLTGKRKTRRAQGINSASSQVRVTPQLIVLVCCSQVSSSNHQQLGIAVVTDRPPSLSSIHQLWCAAQQTIFIFPPHKGKHQTSKQNVTVIVKSGCLKPFKHFKTL